MYTSFGKSANNNNYCYKQGSKSISRDSEKIRLATDLPANGYEGVNITFYMTLTK